MRSEIPDYDIVIVGGGMAGVMAALAAKRTDNRVLVIEPSNVLGGQGTFGGVAGFCGDTKRVNDEFAGLIARLMQHGLIAPYRPNDDRRAYDLEWCAFFLQELVVNRGVEMLLHARVAGARAEEGTVKELTVSSSAGLLALRPRFVVDASGSCVVPLLAGFPVQHEGANRQLPMSLYFTLWDTGHPVKPFLPEGCPRWAHDDEIPMTSLHRFDSGKVEVKMKVVGFDAADGFSRSAAEVFARRQMHGLIYYLQTTGYKGSKLNTHVLASVSRGIGVREERRIVGEHVLTEDEARRAVIFADAVAVNTYHIDFHWPDRMERAGTGITDMLDPHHLPLRMMIPKGARNLLVPGRGASGDQTAMSAYRVMAVVAQMGFAAGQAARLCVKQRVGLRDLDVAELQAAIQAGGQSLNLSDYGEYLCNDIFAQEWVSPGNCFDEQTECLALVQMSNGRFLTAWCFDHELVLMERREKSWLPPRKSGVSIQEEPRSLTLQTEAGGKLGLFMQTKSGMALSFESQDEGVTWRDSVDVVLPGELSLEIQNRSGRLHVAVDSNGMNSHAGSAWLELGQGEQGAAVTRLDSGMVALAFRGPDDTGRDNLSVALSTDDGGTWFARRIIDVEGGSARSPAIVRTRTGLAVMAIDGRRLMFWHGAAERIISGPPRHSAHMLQA